MTAAAKKILEDALALPKPERAALIDALADSLVGEDDDLPPEWKAEIARRIEAVERDAQRTAELDRPELPKSSVSARLGCAGASKPTVLASRDC